MFSCTLVKGVEYYIENARSEEEEQSLGQAAPGVGTRDCIAYHTDAKGEPPGRIWTPDLPVDTSVKFRFSEKDAIADPAVLRAWAQGCDPATGSQMIKRRTQKCGYDLTFSSPKGVGALFAVGGEKEKTAIEKSQNAAVSKALQFAFDNGLICTLSGANSKVKEPVSDCVTSTFLHHSTRALDPEIHSHAILFNVCQREDGKLASVDNRKLLDYQLTMTNIYRTELADQLRDRLGIAITKNSEQDKGFDIDGMPPELIDCWSKRRKDILAAMNERTGVASTKGAAAVAQTVAYETRAAKDPLQSVEQLQDRWDAEVKALGLSREGVIESVRQAAYLNSLMDQRAADEGRVSVEEMHRADLTDFARRSVERLHETNSVVERKALLKAIAEELQDRPGGNIDAVTSELDSMLHEGFLKEIGRTAEGERVYSTPEMIAVEREMLRNALSRKGEREYVPTEIIERHIKSAKVKLSVEQADAVRFALNADGVVVVQGKAGAGKSTSMEAVANASRACGYQVFAIAPSNRAVDVIKTDIHADETAAKALAGFINRIRDPNHKDPITLTDKHVVVLDEAGMCGTRDIAFLLEAARKANCKVVLTGDERQLQAISAGSAMKSIANVCGSSMISVIRRQMLYDKPTDTWTETWQSQASQKFGTGKGDEAINAYDKYGNIHWCEDRASTMAALANDVAEDLKNNPDHTRLVITTRNSDVSALNDVLRKSYRQAGIVTGDDFMVKSIERGSKGKLVDMQLSVGDRLIFGESIKTFGINNADFASIRAIRNSDEPNNPIVTLRLDKDKESDRVIECKWNELQGFRKQGGPQSGKYPKCQHAFACSVHASQGSTVHRSFVYDGHGMGMESIYVACTRHRLDCKIYVDAGRIKDELMDRQSAETAFHLVSKSGHLEAPDIDDPKGDAEKEITLEDVKNVVRAKALKSDGKTNCMDYADNARAWIDGHEELGPKSMNMPVPDPRKNAKRDEVWFFEKEGYEGLSPEFKEYAQNSHARWQSEKPDKRTFGLEEYVAYVQRKHAEHENPVKETYDDSRLWTSKPAPWHPHDRLPPPSPPLTPEALHRQMCGRLADTVGFDAPNLAAVPLPPEISALAERHRDRLAAASQAAAETTRADTTIETPTPDHDPDHDHVHDQAPSPTSKPDRPDTDTTSPAATPDNPDAADRQAERREREQAERQRAAEAARRREAERQRQEASRGFGM